MIGKLVGADWDATLEDDLTWSSYHRGIKERLDRDFPQEKYSGPAFGVPGFAQLAEAASALGARVTSRALPPEAPPGVIY